MKQDLVGERFTMLTVLSLTDLRRHKSILWICVCDCGNFRTCDTGALTTGNTKSCGCLRHKREDFDTDGMLGKVFGVLTVKNRSDPPNNVSRQKLYDCVCICDTIKIVSGPDLRRGDVQSCGCLKRDSDKRDKTKDKRKVVSPEMRAMNALKKKMILRRPIYKVG